MLLEKQTARATLSPNNPIVNRFILSHSSWSITVSKLRIYITLTISIVINTGSLAQSDNSSSWVMQRTVHGYPDFHGYWFFGSRPPLQRSPGLGNRQAYSEAEAEELELAMQNRLDQQDAPLEPNRGAPEKGARIGQEADDAFLGHYLPAELIPINGEYKTSVIYHPMDGRIPRREGFLDFHAKRRASGLEDTDGPEGQNLSGRCLMFGAAVPSLTPGMMNPNLQIVQTKDHIMVLTEMIHDARIIRINDNHLPFNIPQWMGDSVASWEEDTLVVHSKNFRPEQSSSRTITISDEFELTERYTLVSKDEILYEFTVVDNKAYEQPFSGQRILTRNRPEERVYEYACHEGNYSLPGILAGARRLESENNN